MKAVKLPGAGSLKESKFINIDSLKNSFSQFTFDGVPEIYLTRISLLSRRLYTLSLL